MVQLSARGRLNVVRLGLMSPRQLMADGRRDLRPYSGLSYTFSSSIATAMQEDVLLRQRKEVKSTSF